MVGKIIKHELYALLRALTVFALAVLLLSVLARISFVCMGNESLNNYMALFIFFIGIYAVAAGVFLIAPVLTSSEFYYRSLFTGEGYLAYSLPATPAQQILGKLLSAFIFSIGAVLVVFISVLIAFPMRIFSEFRVDIWPQIQAAYFLDSLSLVESILDTLLSVPTAFFFFYLIISVGQLFTKRRKVITFALFFIVSFLLSSMFFLFVSVFTEIDPHLYAWLGIIFDLVFDVAAFFVIRFILTRRINLVAVG